MKNILRYIGNMNTINISEYIDNNCKIYVEPFAGSFGSGFNVMEQRYFYKTVLNDKDYFVYNFWHCIREDSDAVIESINEIYNTLKHLEYKDAIMKLEEYRASKDKFMQAAYEYLYMDNKNVFGNTRKKVKEPKIDRDNFTEISVRLLETDILNLDYLEILDRYDSDETFFMIDPPYNISDVNRYYRGNCLEFNHEQLRERLKNIKGKWIVRYNNEPLTAELYVDTRVLFTTSKNLIGTDYVEVYYTNI